MKLFIEGAKMDMESDYIRAFENKLDDKFKKYQEEYITNLLKKLNEDQFAKTIKNAFDNNNLFADLGLVRTSDFDTFRNNSSENGITTY